MKLQSTVPEYSRIFRGLLMKQSIRRLSHVACGSIRVDPKLKNFVDNAVLPGTSIGSECFWSGMESIVSDLSPKNEALLQKRDELQQKVDAWHASPSSERGDYTTYLQNIGYLCGDGTAQATVDTTNIDPEIATIAGPQLVCPVDNARFILNAANARWGSLLDAFYGTNAVLAAAPAGTYDASRGTAVFDAAHAVLDELFPLASCKWDQVTSLVVDNGQLSVTSDSGTSVLCNKDQFVGYVSSGKDVGRVLMKKHNLHIELVIDHVNNKLGHKAGIVDVMVESAISTICDFEDSACTVDAEDKVAAYTNWLGLMDRSLSAPMVKNGKTFERRLNPPREWTKADDSGLVTLPSQSLLLARNVGMHMYTDMVQTSDGQDVPEQFIDAMVTAASALHSAGKSVYIVKPKMHGPEEVALTVEMFSRVEEVLGLAKNTLKIGMMDEERRTSVNLSECIHEARERLFFINTGFLDRTADEIHTSMEAGPMLPKDAIKGAVWLGGYEANNVAKAVAASMFGKGQIGKGMWAEPDNMSAMMAVKGKQLEAGATTAWVPNPVAATLHTLHYMRTSVSQTHLDRVHDSAAVSAQHRTALLTPPLLGDQKLSAAEVQLELDNNAQGLLGYVVRWVGQGVGCSKVPNLKNVQLMEDRATLRISSQHIANWLRHGLVSEVQVMETLKRVAVLVDEQNVKDKEYRRMSPAYDSPEWSAALDLIFKGCQSPNGYTEDTLSHYRRERKAADALAK